MDDEYSIQSLEIGPPNPSTRGFSVSILYLRVIRMISKFDCPVGDSGYEI